MENNGRPSNGVLKRTPAVSVSQLPGSLPKSPIQAGVDCEEIARSHLLKLLSLSPEDLTESAVWRDLLALTGTFRTFHGVKNVAEAWTNTFGRQSPSDLKLVPNTAKLLSVLDVSSWVDAQFTFQTSGDGPPLSCSGYISLVPNDHGQWKIWMIRTILDEVADYGNVDVLDPEIPSRAIQDSAYGNRERRDGHSDGQAQHFDVIVVGGGQAGLGVGGRLQALGVSYLVVDKFGTVGDRHLPLYRTYDSSYPEFLTKEHIARGHKEYVKRFGINVWQSTEFVSSSWSPEHKMWTCSLNRGGEEVTLTTFHLEQFKGIVLHSSEYRHSNEWKGLRGVVVGSANTAHDVADDMLTAGLASITMVQRGRVLPAEHYMEVTKAYYNAEIPTERADRENFSFPASIRRQIIMAYLHSMARNDSERFDALQNAGFNVERYGDLMHVLFERLGGHYMDVGTSAKISSGLIKVKSGSVPTHYTPDGLAFDDGTELKADVVVFTTGFVQNMRQIAGEIVGPQVADQLDDFWGLDAEGELRGAFKPAGHPGVWFTGGDIGIARYYGRFIALQIKAELMGTPLKVYNS
ncbi:hypothetical protein AYL99_01876 [Fonsecaea erecta]|uniref:FAD/NAD(P)-binding domain-containing protein n=1 Tax=Fonsecaea erecta TaxID=1367422 RepID=A0A178ZS61_9EURO|nr:hypothetical protein AYL99_01876 [Fonsecaea erecta]OAP62649.1 hypothetical protein AYL99_01876 [Fonsecaea erecta]